MQAIILAAGSGKRLKPLTANRPKCMLEVGGRPIFEHQIDALKTCGIIDVIVVAGWHAEVFDPYKNQVQLIMNNDFAETNSLYSFWLCKKWANRKTLLLNGDVLFSSQLLSLLINNENSNSLLFDLNANLDEESMKVQVKDGRVRAISKTLPPAQSSGENLGIIKLSAQGVSTLWESSNRIVSSGQKKSWLPHGIHLICDETPFAAISCANHAWIEIDTPEDLAQAEKEILPQF